MPDGDAQATHGGVVATGALVEHGIPLTVGGSEHGAGGVGLGGAGAGVEPQNLEVGERGAELLLGNRGGRLELAQDGQNLVRQPVFLGVDAQQETDVLGV